MRIFFLTICAVFLSPLIQAQNLVEPTILSGSKYLISLDTKSLIDTKVEACTYKLNLDCAAQVDSNLSSLTLLVNGKPFSSRKLKSGVHSISLSEEELSQPLQLQIIQYAHPDPCFSAQSELVWTRLLSDEISAIRYKQSQDLNAVLQRAQSLVVSSLANEQEVIAAAKFLFNFERSFKRELPLREYDKNFEANPDSNFIFLAGISKVPLALAAKMDSRLPSGSVGIIETLKTNLNPLDSQSTASYITIVTGIGNEGLQKAVSILPSQAAYYLNDTGRLVLEEVQKTEIAQGYNHLGLEQLGVSNLRIPFYGSKRLTLSYDSWQFASQVSEIELKFKGSISSQKPQENSKVRLEIWSGEDFIEEVTFKNSKELIIRKVIPISDRLGSLHLDFITESEDSCTTFIQELNIDSSASGVWTYQLKRKTKQSFHVLPYQLPKHNTVLYYNADLGNRLIKPLASLYKLSNLCNPVGKEFFIPSKNLLHFNLDSIPKNTSTILLGIAKDDRHLDAIELPVFFNQGGVTVHAAYDSLRLREAEVDAIAGLVSNQGRKIAYFFARSLSDGAGLGLLLHKLLDGSQHQESDIMLLNENGLIGYQSEFLVEQGRWQSKFQRIWRNYGNYLTVIAALILIWLFARLIRKFRRAAREF